MTFDLAVLSAARPLGPEEARSIYRAVLAGREWASLLAADPNVDAFAAELRARWPDLSSFAMGDPRSEDSPWAADLEVSAGHVIATVVWTSAEEVEIAFLAMAMRHGIYAYDPQAERLYDPHRDEDRRACAERERQRQAELDRLRQGAPRKAKSGRALAGEAALRVLRDILPQLGMTPVMETPLRVEASFPISDQVQGRARFWPLGGRSFMIDGLVGAAHQGFEEVWARLCQGPDFFTVCEHCISQQLDAYAPDSEVVEAFKARVAKKMAWASGLTDLASLLQRGRLRGPVIGLRQYPGKGGRALLVALSMAGRHAEAEQALAGLVNRTWSPLYRTPTEREGAQVNDEFIQRYNEVFDQHYRLDAEGPLADLQALGLGIASISELRRIGDRAGTAVPVLTKWAASSTYLPLERDLVVLLGKPWVPPSPAGFLAEHFVRRAQADVPDPSLLAAIGESFASTALPSHFANAAEIASNRRYGGARGMFVVAIQRMTGVADRALPLLVSLLDDRAMAPFALDAIAQMRLQDAQPAVHSLLSDRDPVISGRAQQAAGRLKSQPPR